MYCCDNLVSSSIRARPRDTKSQPKKGKNVDGLYSLLFKHLITYIDPFIFVDLVVHSLVLFDLNSL